VVSLDRSVAFPVQSLQRTELIRHIFFNPISFFLSFFLHWCSRLRFGEVTNRRSPSFLYQAATCQRRGSRQPRPFPRWTLPLLPRVASPPRRKRSRRTTRSRSSTMVLVKRPPLKARNHLHSSNSNSSRRRRSNSLNGPRQRSSRTTRTTTTTTSLTTTRTLSLSRGQRARPRRR